MKTCSKCNIEKDLSSFSKNKRSKDGLCVNCKECSSLRHKQWYSKNREEMLSKFREYHELKKDTEKYKEAKKNYYLKSLDKHRELNASWRKLNREYYSNYKAKRRAAELCRTPKWLSENQLIQIKKTYAIAAWMTKEFGEAYQVDHIVPLQGKTVSGLHVPWNLQVITKTDNIKKSNKWQS